jgi:hypothetical protein
MPEEAPMNDYEIPRQLADEHKPDAQVNDVAACASAFDAILAAADARADAGDELFAAAMMTAAEAADGRNALASAPSWDPDRTAARASGTLSCQDIAGIAGVLADVLYEAAARTSDDGEIVAWRRAARCADRICDLMTGDTS